MKHVITFLFSAIILGACATLPNNPPRSVTDHKNKVLVSSDKYQPINATLEDAAWLKGTWIGSRYPGHQVQHVILDNQINHMPGFVRSWTDEDVWFYEITVFADTGDSIAYQVKHFGYDLKGWEGQNEFIDRPLLGKAGTSLQFDGITFERIGRDSFTVYFRIPEGADEGNILVIPFKRESK